MRPKVPSEAQFQRQVVQLSKFYGWRSYHTFDSRRSDKGWPDLVLCRPPEVIFVELKAKGGRLRPEQRDWTAALRACDLEVYVWYPDDFDVLHERLARGRAQVKPLYREDAA